MGCDIHLMVEVRREGKWETADRWLTTDWPANPFYDSRDYTTFAVLAGVRNRDGVTPISPPKGMPEDVSPEVMACIMEWSPDAHSLSWLTLRELHEYSVQHQPEGEMWDRVLPSLWMLADIVGGPEDVRVVFFFDN